MLTRERQCTARRLLKMSWAGATVIMVKYVGMVSGEEFVLYP